MQPEKIQLSKYRIERANEDILTAKVNLENGLYKGAVNRSYYAIFHAIRAVNAYFNQFHVHTGNFDKNTYKIIDSAYRIREKCDYSDFFIVSKKEAEEQYNKSVEFIECVQKYLDISWNE